MKTMGIRFGMLLLGLADMLQLRMIRTLRPHRLQARQFDGGPVARPEPPVNLGDSTERGDVPGWVMITLMSAVLVAALLALAGPALEAMFNQAMDKVGN